MALIWVSESWVLHSAEACLGAGEMVRFAVESLGETGWEWHVWDVAHRMRPRRGGAATLDGAKAGAERAFAEMAEMLNPAM